MVRLRIKLCELPDSRLVKRVFEWDYNRANDGLRSWNSHVRDIFRKCHMANFFDSCRISGRSIDVVLSDIRKHCMNRYVKDGTTKFK